jgi:DnaJ-class molecular chaperone
MHNPYHTLGVTESATDEDIRTAYLASLRQYSPELYPQQFQQIQQANDLIKNDDCRLRYRLFHVDTISSETIAEYIKPDNKSNKRVGFETFQAVLKRALNLIT